jgi:carboxypeptidase C (cathepsin A)
MKKVTLALFVITFTMGTMSCNQSQKTNEQSNTKEKIIKTVKEKKTQKLSGNYICTEHWNKDLEGQIKMTFNNDSVSFPVISNTTYRIKDDSLFIDMHQYEMGFIIDGNTLTANGNAGKVSYTKK